MRRSTPPSEITVDGDPDGTSTGVSAPRGMRGSPCHTKEKGWRQASPFRSETMSTRLRRAGLRCEYRVVRSGPRPSAEGSYPPLASPSPATVDWWLGPSPHLAHGAGAARRFASCWRSLRRMATGSFTGCPLPPAASRSSGHLLHVTRQRRGQARHRVSENRTPRSGRGRLPGRTVSDERSVFCQSG